MPLKGRLIIITAFAITVLFALGKLTVFALAGAGIHLQSIALLGLSGAHFYFLDRKRYYNARFTYGAMLSIPGILALLFFDYGSLGESGQILMLAYSIAMTHIGILLMFSKNVTAYLQAPFIENQSS